MYYNDRAFYISLYFAFLFTVKWAKQKLKLMYITLYLVVLAVLPLACVLFPLNDAVVSFVSDY